MLRRWVVPPVLLAGMAAGSAGAQVTTTGNIRVVVTDQDSLAVPGATVTAAAEDAATTRVAVTDLRGEAELAALNPSTRYVVTVELQGFQTSRQEDFLVRAGQTASARVTLTAGNVTETVVVTAASPVVDVTSAVVAEDITLDLTEAVPTGRTYQSYLQLVPGVFPDDPESPGNPASKSGLNYSDIGGNTSVSRDNFYYIDGINVTDGVSGTFGANLNTEIIQEQQVLTGGIPAEYVGAPGLLSSVITKSGTNQFSGSVNYFLQNDGLVAENRNAADLEFSRFDAAVSSAACSWPTRGRTAGTTGRCPTSRLCPASRNSIVFRDTDVRTLEDEQLGGFGLDDLDQRDTVGYKGTAVVQVGRHAIHGGVEFMRNTNFRDTTYDGGLYVSLSPALSGLTAGGLIAGSVTNTQFDPTNSSDYTGFIRAIDGLANRAEFYALYDGNRDGTITQDELGASLAFRASGRNLPLRVATGEEFEYAEHVATDGTNVFAFDWTFAPRLARAGGGGHAGQP